MKKRCTDGCCYLSTKENVSYCLKKDKAIKNKGSYCKEFKQETVWTKLSRFFTLFIK